MKEAVLIKDTREPDFAWDAYFSAPVITKKLETGDYSLQGFENQIAIERKTLNDLMACLGKGRARFERELERSRSLDFFCVIVEAGYSQMTLGDYRSRLNPKAAIESISAFEIRYGIHFLFTGNQALAAQKCESLLLKFWREHHVKPLAELERAIMQIQI